MRLPPAEWGQSPKIYTVINIILKIAWPGWGRGPMASRAEMMIECISN